LSITADESSDEKRRTITKMLIAVIVILLVSAYLGNYLLAFFGINIDSFRVAGGILLLLMAIHMLQAKMPPTKTSKAEENEAVQKEDVSVVPLAIPLTAGPGTISTVILFSSNTNTLVDQIALGIIILLSALTIWPILMLAESIGKYLGATGLNVATRIMGLILAAIAVQFIIEGILNFVKTAL
ncbi:MAG TPA: NAAT family transporter, partial [Epsilonproteobacteria bacterium]|nr:NAAT family transporter [Campylobacterota bacterium]